MYRLDFHIRREDEDDFTDRLFDSGAGSVAAPRGRDGGVVPSAIFAEAGDAGD